MYLPFNGPGSGQWAVCVCGQARQQKGATFYLKLCVLKNSNKNNITYKNKIIISYTDITILTQKLLLKMKDTWIVKRLMKYGYFIIFDVVS